MPQSTSLKQSRQLLADSSSGGVVPHASLWVTHMAYMAVRQPAATPHCLFIRESSSQLVVFKYTRSMMFFVLTALPIN